MARRHGGFFIGNSTGGLLRLLLAGMKATPKLAFTKLDITSRLLISKAIFGVKPTLRQRSLVISLKPHSEVKLIRVSVAISDRFTDFSEARRC